MAGLADNMVDLAPSMLFANTQYGRGLEAMELYQSIFANSGTDVKELYGPGDHQFQFNEAFSYVVQCEDQAEIDHYWNSLIANGGNESMCGWLKDPYGVSWQIIPASLSKLMSNPATSQNVMQALFKMKKLDLATLENAAQ
ncbi:MAG: VOC family protein [Bacteroidetes bacterium]|nr:VOC family protein [Bacteroidota bacterium]